MRSSSRLVLVGLLSVAACAPGLESGESNSGGRAESDLHRGTVQIVGSAPVNIQVVLQPESGSTIRLTGALVGELQRLQGALVAVHGPVTASPDPIVSRQIEVSSYEIVSINGGAVVMGEIISIEGGSARLRTDDGTEVLVSGVPAAFRVGQKVWVQGPHSVTVQSYGTVRP